MLGPIFVGRGAEKAKEIFPMSLVFSTEKWGKQKVSIFLFAVGRVSELTLNMISLFSPPQFGRFTTTHLDVSPNMEFRSIAERQWAGVTRENKKK